MIILYIARDFYCKYCDSAEKLLKQYNIHHKIIPLNRSEIEEMKYNTGKHGVPYIFTKKGDFIGGYEDLERWIDLSYDMNYYSERDLKQIAKTLHEKI